MNTFDPDASVLAGLDRATLQAWLNKAQTAYADLATGAKIVTVSYSQSTGARAVTYAQTDIASLLRFIRLLQAQLGIVCTPRRAIGVKF